jgi:hypothetical protein
MHRVEAVRDGARTEDGPTVMGVSEIVVHDGHAIIKTVNARPFVNLNLKEFEDSHRFTRRGDELQFSTW